MPPSVGSSGGWNPICSSLTRETRSARRPTSPCFRSGSGHPWPAPRARWPWCSAPIGLYAVIAYLVEKRDARARDPSGAERPLRDSTPARAGNGGVGHRGTTSVPAPKPGPPGCKRVVAQVGQRNCTGGSGRVPKRSSCSSSRSARRPSRGLPGAWSRLDVPLDAASRLTRILTPGANRVTRWRPSKETVDAKPVSQTRAPERSTGVSTSGEAGRSDLPIRRAGRRALRFRRPVSQEAVRPRHQRRFEGGATDSGTRRGTGTVEAFLILWRTSGAHGPGATVSVLCTALRLGIDEHAPGDPEGPSCATAETRRGHADPGRTAPRLGDERWTSVLRVIAAIRREHAAMLLLRSQGFSYDEMATTLDLRSASVGTLLRRARQVLCKEYVRSTWPDMTIPTSTAGWTTGWQPWVRPRRARRRPSGHWRN